jgi:hypothetical protein
MTLTPFEDASRKAIEFGAGLLILGTLDDLVQRIEEIEKAKVRIEKTPHDCEDLTGLTDAINADYIRIDQELAKAAIGIAQVQGIEA